MSKYKQYCIYNKYTRKTELYGSYQYCLEYYNSKDSTFRKQNKIIPYNND